MTIEEKLNAVLEWAESTGIKKGFDADFIYSLKEYYEEYDTLTDRQENALDSIIEKWNIGID